MLMMNMNGIFTERFLNLAKKLVKSKPTNLKIDRIGIIRTGLLSQNQREEIITTHVNLLRVVHALEVAQATLGMAVDALEIIEDVPETNVIIVDSNQIKT